jgi:hypothetical protein
LLALVSIPDSVLPESKCTFGPRRTPRQGGFSAERNAREENMKRIPRRETRAPRSGKKVARDAV